MGEAMMLAHHIPRLHCNLRGHAKISPKAQIFGRTREQLAKPSACPAHHLLALAVGIINRHPLLLNTESNKMHKLLEQQCAKLAANVIVGIKLVVRGISPLAIVLNFNNENTYHCFRLPDNGIWNRLWGGEGQRRLIATLG